MRHRYGPFYFGLVLVALLAPLGGGCEEEPPVDPPPPDPFGDLYGSATFQMCADCHSPSAPGFTQGTEATQDWSSRDAAFTSLQGVASGLEGNFAGCNGVPLIGATSSTSLLVAVLDPDVRASFSLEAFPDCTADAIADETLRVGAVPPTVLQDLKDFIDEGGFN